MISPKIFPYTLILLDLLASGAYFINGDIRRGIYWIAAATLTLTVTL